MQINLHLYKVIYLNCGERHEVFGIVEVLGSNPVQALNFFQALISKLLKLCI